MAKVDNFLLVFEHDLVCKIDHVNDKLAAEHLDFGKDILKFAGLEFTKRGTTKGTLAVTAAACQNG